MLQSHPSLWVLLQKCNGRILLFKNVPNIKPLLTWGGSFQVTMALLMLRTRTEPELISCKTPLFRDYRLGHYPFMGMGNKRQPLDLSKSEVPGCRHAQWLTKHYMTIHWSSAKTYQTLKDSSSISLPLQSLLPSSCPQNSAPTQSLPPVHLHLHHFFPQRTETPPPKGTSGNFSCKQVMCQCHFRQREVEGGLKHMKALGFPRFGHSQKKQGAALISSAHSLPWDRLIHFPWGGKYGLDGWQHLTHPWPAHSYHAEHPALGSGLAPNWASPTGSCWTCSQLLTLGRVLMPGLLPWDCCLELVTLGPGPSPRPADFKTSWKNTFRKKCPLKRFFTPQWSSGSPLRHRSTH